MSKVFISHVVKRLDRRSDSLMPVFDFSPAAQFGSLVQVVGPEDNVQFLAHLAPKIRAALSEFQEGDYFLAAGDPSVIAICAGIIARRHQKFNMLKWDRRLSIYNHIEVRP